MVISPKTSPLSPADPTIEAVLRREATVSDFVASRFEGLPGPPLGPSAGLSRRLRGIFRGVLGACRQMAVAQPRFAHRPVADVVKGRSQVTAHHSPSFRANAQGGLTVTYYYPWGYFYPVRSGAAAVASRHLDYFRQRGHRVRMMLRAAPNRGRAAFERHYHWVDEIAVVDTRKYPDARRCFDSWDLASYLAGHARLAERPEIREWLSQPADVVFLNYVFATPLLDALPGGAHRVLEAYDIMSHQFLEHRELPDLLQRSLACEFDLYRLYDSVLMINQEEEQLALAHGAANLVYMPPSVDVAPEGSATGGHEDYDLLFVGSDHAPNVEGVNWFYDHVYRPLLKPRGLRWAICGSVCRQLRFKDPGVLRLGSVADLADVYRRSKVVVVPLFRGSGISIKTLEAMGHHKAVVTTPCGRRGLPAVADNALLAYPFGDAPAAVAQAICRLCSSDALRRDYGRRAAHYVDRYWHPTAHRRRMDSIFAPVTRASVALHF